MTTFNFPLSVLLSNVTHLGQANFKARNQLHKGGS